MTDLSPLLDVRRGLAERRRFVAFAGNRLAMVGAILVGIVVVMAVFGPIIAPQSHELMQTDRAYESPSAEHLAGTDQFGRDVFSRIVVGARTSLLISATGVAGALLLGGSVGLLAGFIGGRVDLLLSRVIDVLLAIPALLIAIGIVAVIGPSGTSVAIALTAAYSPTFARVIRSVVVAARHQTYVEASRGLGVPRRIIVLRDIIPNVLPIVTVQATSALAWGILDEANLGFLGLGVQPPTPSWGSMLIEGRTYMFRAPWLPIAAGLAVIATVFGFNLLGDRLRDKLDPRAMSDD